MKRMTASIVARTRLFASLAVATALLVVSSCTFIETNQFEAFWAPPNGVHITIFQTPTKQLGIVRALVASNFDVNPALAKQGLNTTCATGNWDLGDRCAWNILRNIPIQLQEDGVIPWSKEVLANAFWADAIDERNFGDFRDNLAISTNRCLHVTIRNWGDWPVEWRTSDWQFRENWDNQCKVGVSL